VHLESALERDTPSRHRWGGWTRREPALAGRSYAGIRAELRAGGQQRKDDILGALVRITQDDPTAFGVIAACLLPGLRQRIARYAACLDRQEAFAVAMAALYEAVAGYDTCTRPRFVAGRLLAPVERRLRQAVRRQRTWILQPDDAIEVADPQAVVDLSAGSILESAIHAEAITVGEAQLIVDTRVVGTPLREAGRRLGLGYEAAKKRRQRAEARWVAWSLPDRLVAAEGDGRGPA
jgi:hypothetical protein